MSVLQDVVDVFVAAGASDFSALTSGPVSTGAPTVPGPSGVLTARLRGFDLEDRPELIGLPQAPNEIVTARTTVPLSRAQIGAAVVVVCEHGDVRLPIVLGVIQHKASATAPGHAASAQVVVQADEDRIVLSAEREIVLSCGDARITLTRAGKVVIEGRYVMSRASGYNRIKGAAVDIN